MSSGVAISCVWKVIQRDTADLLLYYITDRSQFAGDEAYRRRSLIETITEAVSSGVDYIQLREKDLNSRELEILGAEVVAIVRKARAENQKIETRVLINSRTDVAIACRADGVHLRSDDISAIDVRKIWAQSGRGALEPVTIGVSCHTLAEVAHAAAGGADFAVFGPIFEQKTIAGGSPPGLDGLRQASQARMPVLALGGITVENAGDCMQAGAAGIAGIRLFQENKISKVVASLRSSVINSTKD